MNTGLADMAKAGVFVSAVRVHGFRAPVLRTVPE
jgi:hypothetical protein